ncbi:DUF4148 domain-containing protein [Paraburkholderia tuberum]|uniref:DUF4148 domain-containing protein n=1 Tax=Paraburkholderia tuberum TaxID=157910 RepID=A0A1H1KFP5_9BURK|nr:DUF4148 domain-containing protein [Paraburkholderia tuberum]SDR60892.1 protein of unknown function [Paraburkholderia tuberum]
MRKIAIFGVALATSMILSPAFAQSSSASGTVSRAQVKQELRTLQKAGFDPTDTYGYPANLASAERKVSAQPVVDRSEGAQPAHLTLTQSNAK